jgi:multiple sugar transport system ATP-binding protein
MPDLPLILPLPEAEWTRGRAEIQRVTVGVRPERLLIDTDRPKFFEATIELSSMAGAEGQLLLKAGGISLTARVPSAEDYRLGRRVRVSVVPEDVHIFDPVDGARLLR